MRAAMLLLLLVSFATEATQFTGKVIAVLDGDTILVLRNGSTPVKVRLFGIDAPELAQTGGMESRKSLSGMVLYKQVSVNKLATDVYGRLVAYIELAGKSVNQELLRQGMAWEYSRFHANKTYSALQFEAQQAGRGLWASTGAIEPALWRKAHAIAPLISASLDSENKEQQEDYSCNSKHFCKQMRSCDEAYFYLDICDVKSLDGNQDGMPCEDLCSGMK